MRAGFEPERALTLVRVPGRMRAWSLGMVTAVICAGCYRWAELSGVCMALLAVNGAWRAPISRHLVIEAPLVRQAWFSASLVCVTLGGSATSVAHRRVWIYRDEVSTAGWRRLRRWLKLVTPQTPLSLIKISPLNRWV